MKAKARLRIPFFSLSTLLGLVRVSGDSSASEHHARRESGALPLAPQQEHSLDSFEGRQGLLKLFQFVVIAVPRVQDVVDLFLDLYDLLGQFV